MEKKIPRIGAQFRGKQNYSELTAVGANSNLVPSDSLNLSIWLFLTKKVILCSNNSSVVELVSLGGWSRVESKQWEGAWLSNYHELTQERKIISCEMGSIYSDGIISFIT